MNCLINFRLTVHCPGPELDWSTQSVEMADIYQYAIINVAPNKATGCHDGILKINQGIPKLISFVTSRQSGFIFMDPDLPE